MSRTIYNVGLAELLPPNFAEDNNIQATCAALDAMNTLVVGEISKVLVLASLGNQPSAITDILAIEQRTPYYKQSFELPVRRALLANTGEINAIKGTKAAVEKTAKIVFGSATVEEWFEYSGDPFHFRVLVNEFPNSDSQVSEVENAVASVKNARSVLDEVIIIAATAKVNSYVAGVVLLAPVINVTQTA